MNITSNTLFKQIKVYFVEQINAYCEKIKISDITEINIDFINKSISTYYNKAIYKSSFKNFFKWLENKNK